MSKALEDKRGESSGSRQQTHPCTCGFAQRSHSEHHHPTSAITKGRQGGFADKQKSGDLQHLNSPSTPSSSFVTAAVSPSFRDVKGLGNSATSGDVKSPSGNASSSSSQGERSLRESIIRNGDVQPARSLSVNASSPSSSFPRERSLQESSRRRSGDLQQAKDSSANGSPSSLEAKSFKERSLGESSRRRSGDLQQAKDFSTNGSPSSPAAKSLRERGLRESSRNGDVQQAAHKVNAPPSGQGSQRSPRDSIRSGGGDVQLVKSSSVDAASPSSTHRARSLRESTRIGGLQQAKSPSLPSPSRASPAGASPSIHGWGNLGESVISGGPHSNSAASPSRAAPLASASTTCTSLKSKLAAGHKLYGAFLVSFSTVVAEILGWAGYDFVVVDLGQLFPGDNFAALPVVQALASTGTPAIFRLSGDDPVLVNKALDMGPAGLMFSMIEDEEAARNAVALCRYPPGGIRRGSRHVVSRASHYGLDASYVDRCEEELFVICQVETTEAFNHVMEIAGVEGVDCIHMGGLDFGASLGDPYLDYNTRLLFCHAEEKILARQGKVLLAGLATPDNSPESLFKRGYHLVAGTMDVVLLRDAAVSDLRRNKPSFKI
ncbi:unnamed protein product [Calypogeia fissa]